MASLIREAEAARHAAAEPVEARSTGTTTIALAEVLVPVP